VSADLTLPEQRTHRDALADHAEVLDRVGALMLLPDDTHATTDLVAGYFQVTTNTIYQLVTDHRDELDSDGYAVLTGERLTAFKTVSRLSSRAPSLALFPRRAILRVGMLLRDSTVARAVRDALLDAEQSSRPSLDLTNLSDLAQILAAGNAALQVAQREAARADAAEHRLIEAAPAIDYHDRFVSDDDVTTVQDWAAQFGLTEPAAFELLRERKVVYRKLIETRWSRSKHKLVKEYEHFAYAGPTFDWFDRRPQHNAPRHHNGQVRRTLYVRQAFSLDLGRRLGPREVGTQGVLIGGDAA